MDLHSLDLVLVIISCFIVLGSGVDFTDGQEIIKNRTFVSKARAEFIRQRRKLLDKNNPEHAPVFKDAEALRVPLCAYVEEEEPIEQQKVDENAPFEDPNLGCIKCQIEPHEQCEDIPKNICTLRPDPNCKICPKSETGLASFDITEENEAFEKCDGSVSKDKFGRLVIFETKCKKFSSSRCRLARNFRRKNCLEREICYQKPRLLTKRAMRNMKCSSKSLPAKIKLRKIVKKPQFNCQTTCPPKKICETITVKNCQTTNVRICDSLPDSECKKPPIIRRIVLKCTEIAEIPHELVKSLNGNQTVAY